MKSPRNEEAAPTDETDQDVPVDVMPQLVRDHGFDFVVVELPHECVSEDDPSGPPESCEARVGLARGLAQIECEDPVETETGARAEIRNALTKGALGEGGEPVEEGKDHHRGNSRDEHRCERQKGADRKPPLMSERFEARIRRDSERAGDRQRHEHALHVVP